MLVVGGVTLVLLLLGVGAGWLISTEKAKDADIPAVETAGRGSVEEPPAKPVALNNPLQPAGKPSDEPGSGSPPKPEGGKSNGTCLARPAQVDPCATIEAAQLRLAPRL
jgi:hypothetical protein